jgi:hypothetical protein
MCCVALSTTTALEVEALSHKTPILCGKRGVFVLEGAGACWCK